MQAEIKGTTMPVLQLVLDRGDSVITPHGELVWMSKSVHMSQTTRAGRRRTAARHQEDDRRRRPLRHQVRGPGQVTFAARLPGQIVPVDIGHGESYLVHKHGWLASTHGIRPGTGIQHSLGAGCSAARASSCRNSKVKAPPGSRSAAS